MDITQYALAFNQHPLPMWIHDKETLSFLDVNERLLEVLGYDRAEFLKMKLQDVLPDHKNTPLFLDLKPDSTYNHPPPPLHIHCKDGHFLPVHVISNSLQTGANALLVTLIIPQKNEPLEKRTLEARLRISQFAYSHSLDQLLQKTLDESEQLTGSTIGFFHFVEEDQQTIWLQNWSTNDSTAKRVATLVKTEKI